MTEEEAPHTFEDSFFKYVGSISSAFVGYATLGIALLSIGLTPAGPAAGSIFAEA